VAPGPMGLDGAQKPPRLELDDILPLCVPQAKRGAHGLRTVSPVPATSAAARESNREGALALLARRSPCAEAHGSCRELGNQRYGCGKLGTKYSA